MSERNTKQNSATDWDRIDSMTDDMIDVFDIPSLDDSFFDEVKLWMPPKMVPVTLNVD